MDATGAQKRELIARISVSAGQPATVLGIAVQWLKTAGNDKERGLADAIDETVKRYVSEGLGKT